MKTPEVALDVIPVPGVKVTAVGVTADVYALVPRGQSETVETVARLDHEPLIAPIAAGEKLGSLTVTDGSGAVVANAPLVALAAVPQGGLWTRMVDGVALWLREK